MDELREFFSRIKLVPMRTPNLVKVALTLVIVLCMVVLITLRIATNDLNSRTEQLHGEAAALDHANQELTEKIGALGSIQSVIDIAREKLGLVEPGTVFFETLPPESTGNQEAN